MLDLDPSVWRTVVGSSVEIPPVNSQVYYFPEGHLERVQHNHNLTLSHPFIPCKILSSDKPLVRMTLLPSRLRPAENTTPVAAPENDVVSFVPKFCAEMIFPQLAAITTPAQDLSLADAGNHTWEFRHILSTGWSQFVRSKRLATGDTLVFMKKKSTAELFVGVRRRAYQYGSGRREGEGGEVVEAVRRAAEGKELEVVYYPEFGWPDFVVKKEKVKDAIKTRWTAGMKVRMGVDGDDFSRLSLFRWPRLA